MQEVSYMMRLEERVVDVVDVSNRDGWKRKNEARRCESHGVVVGMNYRIRRAVGAGFVYNWHFKSRQVQS